jgi:ABC-type sugar transport system permease subunit
VVGRRQVGIVERQKRRLVIPFLLPALAVYGFFMLYPAFSTFYVAVTDWDGVRLPKFVGLHNFTQLASDEVFRSTIGHTITFTVLGALVLFPVALLFAVTTQHIAGGKLYRFLILAPVALSVTTAALLWKFMLNPAFGFIPAALRALGMDRLAGSEPLGQPSTAMLVVVAATVWHGVGIWMTLFAAALERVPPELREAATLDGASGLQAFRYVVWPLIWDVTRTLLILWLIQGLQTFAFIIAMTNGGPLRSTEVIGTYLYSVAFSETRYGYAAAIAIVLFFSILVLTLGVNRLTKRESEQY